MTRLRDPLLHLQREAFPIFACAWEPAFVLSIINIPQHISFSPSRYYFISQRERIYAQAEQGGSVILAPEYPGDVVSELIAIAFLCS